MANDSATQGTVANRPVSLPARGFEHGDLQAKLEAAAAGIGDDPAEAEAIMRRAVREALSDDQVGLDHDPALIPGFHHVVIQDDDTGEMSTTQVQLPADATPAQKRAVAEAAPERDGVLAESGKVRSAKTAGAENIEGGDAS